MPKSHVQIKAEAEKERLTAKTTKAETAKGKVIAKLLEVTDQLVKK